MILPLLCSIMCGRTALETINAAFRSMSTTWRKSSTDISTIGILLMMPALLTRMSTGPISSAIFATIAATSSSFVTSQM